MYTKFIGDRQVFSECRVIEYKGKFISNPTKKQITAAGWTVYVPPVVPPTPQLEPRNEEVMEAVKRMLSTSAASLTDEEALAVAALFDSWNSKIGKTVKVDERLWYDEGLYKVLQEHVAQVDWTPAATPALFAKVSIEEWPEWVQPTSAETAYNTGDKVTFEGKHYISQINANVWSPAEYPAGWQIVE